TIAPEQEREFTVDYTAAADNPISDLAPVDTVPPVITITSPLENSQYPHNQVINIDYTAADDFSGLASTTITIDGQAIAAATLDLFYYLNGEHALTIAVSDRAGNLASSTVKFKIISSLDSVISDIARLYALGWITDRTTGKIMDTEIEEINWRFKLLDEAKRLIAKYIKKVETSQNTAKIKAKLIQRYHEDLERLDQKNSKNINIVFDRLARSLGKYLKAKLINQAGYDIIMSDINYLRNNL
ncbi:MAG: Ig-like domain-containing protein, partial [Candidatus Azambacteria bacterium]|nr:Ig-like domain-containing protein [Candidatus Azambacteria bacterium]